VLICLQDCFCAVPSLGPCPPSLWQRTCIRTSWSPGGARRAGSQARPLFPAGRFSTLPEGLLPPLGFVLAVILRGFAHRRQAFLPSQRPLGRAMTRSPRPGPRPAQLWFCQSGPLKSRLASCRNSPVWSIFTECWAFRK